MQAKDFRTPQEITEISIGGSSAKVNRDLAGMLLMGFMGGLFIALAGQGSNTGSFQLLLNPETYGLGKIIAGFFFSVGLMMVILAGGELYTGNVLIIGAVLAKTVSVAAFLKNLVVIYFGNLVGSVFASWLIVQSGVLSSASNSLAALTIRTAAGKASIDFGQAILLGILCNILVCAAIWLSYSSNNTVGKIFAIFFPISLFVLSGYEHSVANMFYIPVGILAKANPAYVEAALSAGVSADAIANLSWSTFFINNLIPVTIGNFIGGAVFIGVVYWFLFHYPNQKNA